MSLEKFTDQVFNQDALEGMKLLPDETIDLIVADPPYNLGKDYGNDSDKRESEAFLRWTEE
jgi:site-specific DNA-methyltransferase (adenine-specific)